MFKSSEREKHRNKEPGWLRRMFSKNITGIKSSIIVHNPLVKRSKKGSDEYSDQLSNPAPPRKHNEIYLETQMLRSVDDKGKFLQSGTFPQKNWMQRSPLSNHELGDTQTSCYSAV